MKLKYFGPLALLFPLMAGVMTTSCSDDEELIGNPVIDYRDATETAHFGDSLAFTVNASDADVALSTLKAQLYYGDEMVEETVIRTKVSGQDYSGKIYLPYFANVPDGTATLKLVLQNINFTITEKSYSIAVTHADFPYLTLRTEDGTEYRMEKTATDTYSVSNRFAQKLKAYIVAPKVGDNGNELVFGYESNEIKVGAESMIPFSSSRGGKYTIELNTRTFEATPFTVLKINDTELETVDDDNAQIDMALTKGQILSLEGFTSLGDWWIDSDWFTRNDDGTLTFTAMSGTYRIIANQKLQYFRVETLLNGQPASLQSDGSGAIWVIGTDFGKPSVNTNATGWVTEKAVCMAPVADKVYQMTLVGSKTVNLTSINFKFYGGAMSWADEFKHTRITSTSSTVLVGDGTDHDDGNLYLADGKTLKANMIYVFRIDCTAGTDKAVLSVTEAGEQAFEEKPIYLNGAKMTTADNSIYTLITNLNQGAKLEFNTISNLDEFYIDPDFMSYDADNDAITFRPVAGTYQVTVDKYNNAITAQRYDGESPATLTDDGHGTIYLMGDGVGSLSVANTIGWDTSKAYAMAEVASKVYQFTAVAGSSTDAENGQRISYNNLNFKFFWQKGWGGEFSNDYALTLASDSEALLKMTSSGNFNLASGTTLELGATYVITIDLNAGVSAGVISIAKK